MTHRPRSTLLALVAVLSLAGCAASAAGPAAPLPAVPVPATRADAGPLPGAATRTALQGFIDRLTARPDDIAALLGLGGTAVQLARETADPTEYGRAEAAFRAVLDREPGSVDALVGLGTVALARHAFADGLALGDAALALQPRSARALGVRADALVELGRYEDAKDAVQRMVDLRPDLASYARVSYQRELRGDLDGAIAAMEAAVTAGGPAAENTAYLRVILGNLWFLAGDLDRADGAMTAALADVPGYAFALAGRARVTMARGDLETALAGWQAAADRVPFPELLIALGEGQEAAGRTNEAAATYALVRDIAALFAANGVATDLDLAAFEADHGDPARAVELAQAAWAETPNVKAADALGWALHQAGRDDEARPMAEAALRMGSLEPAYTYHAGMIAAAQGDDAAARAWLTASLARNPHWSPLHAPRAAAALQQLDEMAEATR